LTLFSQNSINECCPKSADLILNFDFNYEKKEIPINDFLKFESNLSNNDKKFSDAGIVNSKILKNFEQKISLIDNVKRPSSTDFKIKNFIGIEISDSKNLISQNNFEKFKFLNEKNFETKILKNEKMFIEKNKLKFNNNLENIKHETREISIQNQNLEQEERKIFYNNEKLIKKQQQLFELINYEKEKLSTLLKKKRKFSTNEQ
jgi:hypothetical protein